MSRLLLVVNPVSGRRNGARLAKEIVSKLAARGVGVDVLLSERAGHVLELVVESDLDSYHALGVVGGDGTVNEVVNGLMMKPNLLDIPLALFAGGTGNSIHQHLGVESIDSSIERVTCGSTAAIDVLEVTLGNQKTICINMIGWAGVAEIASRAERLRWVGAARYSISAFVQIFFAQRTRATIRLDDQRIDDRLFLVIGCNTRQVGSGMKMAPKASLTDGLLDVVIVRNASRLKLLSLLRRVHSGTHIDLPCVEYRQVRELEIDAEQPSIINLDGDVPSSIYSKVQVRVVPAAIKVFA